MDLSSIEAFAETFANSPRLAEIEVDSPSLGTLRFRRSLDAADKKAKTVRKKPATPANTPASSAEPLASPTNTNTVVLSTLVGIFRTSRKAGVTLGTRVESGQVIGMVEVMRLSDEVTAPVTGTISSIFVQDGLPVEYGQPLFEITPEEGTPENVEG